MGYNIVRQIRKGHKEFNVLIRHRTCLYNSAYAVVVLRAGTAAAKAARDAGGDAKAAKAAAIAAKAVVQAGRDALVAEYVAELAAIHPTAWANGTDINVLATLGDILGEGINKEGESKYCATYPGGSRSGYVLQSTLENESGESISAVKRTLKESRERGMLKAWHSPTKRSCLDYHMPDVWQAYYAARDELLARWDAKFEAQFGVTPTSVPHDESDDAGVYDDALAEVPAADHQKPEPPNPGVGVPITEQRRRVEVASPDGDSAWVSAQAATRLRAAARQDGPHSDAYRAVFDAAVRAEANRKVA